MPEVICNTSPLQYLHQLGKLDILPALAKTVTVPPAVTAELAEGQRLGVNVPELRGLDWVTVRTPASLPALSLASDLGPGESQALALALETEDSLIVLDDGLGRRVAEALGLRLTGTLGCSSTPSTPASFVPSVPCSTNSRPCGSVCRPGREPTCLGWQGKAPTKELRRGTESCGRKSPARSACDGRDAFRAIRARAGRPVRAPCRAPGFFA